MSKNPVIGNIQFGPTEYKSLLPDGMSLLEAITPVYKFNNLEVYGYLCKYCSFWRKHEYGFTGDCLSPKLKRAFPEADEAATPAMLQTGENFGCVNFQNKE